jgi:hypothetical protein
VADLPSIVWICSCVVIFSIGISLSLSQDAHGILLAVIVVVLGLLEQGVALVWLARLGGGDNGCDGTCFRVRDGR